MKPIAYIKTNLEGKFGLPRQSGIMPRLMGRVIFDPEYRVPDAFRGLEGFSHVWLIWDFSEAHCTGKGTGKGENAWSATVRPPRLGGNTRMGVFATRSPFRPNNIGLSVVKLESVDMDSEYAPSLLVSGVDMMDGTPIYDVKPYIPYSDCITDATSGFTDGLPDLTLSVDIPEHLLKLFPVENHGELMDILSHDPRPQYQSDDREYGLTYMGKDIKFRIADGILTVTDVVSRQAKKQME